MKTNANEMLAAALVTWARRNGLEFFDAMAFAHEMLRKVKEDAAAWKDQSVKAVTRLDPDT